RDWSSDVCSSDLRICDAGPMRNDRRSSYPEEARSMTTESRICRMYDVAMLVDMIHQTPRTAARRRAAYRTMKRRLFKLDTIARRRARRAARKEARTTFSPDVQCQRCADYGTVATDYGRIRCDCGAGKAVDLIPERTPEEHRETAYTWSSNRPGRGLALYQYASTNGEIADYEGIMQELDA